MTDLPKIEGIQYRKHDGLEDYQFNAPIGEWSGRLDDRAWGKSSNLFLYFTDVATGEKYRLSVFSRGGYSPYQGEVNFREEPLGGVYIITTDHSKNGLPKFMKATHM